MSKSEKDEFCRTELKYPVNVPAWILSALIAEVEKNGTVHVQWFSDALKKVAKSQEKEDEADRKYRESKENDDG